MRRVRALIICLAAGTAAVSAFSGAPAATSPLLDRFLVRDSEAGPARYRALRHLEAKNARFGASAWMDVWTDFDESAGLRYEIASESGSGQIRRRVFRAALEGEQKLWQDKQPQQSGFTHSNYMFEEGGSEGALETIGITPRRKDVLLVQGRLLVKPDDGDLMRVEGRLSKTPSFWTRRVEVVRRYGRVGGAHVPLEIESTAQVLLAGPSTFRMTYEYESINGQSVGAPQPRLAPASNR